MTLLLFTFSRLLQALLNLISVAFILSLVFFVIAGDPSLTLAGPHATPETIESLRQELGLDQSLPQLLFQQISSLLTFNWGVSWQTQQSVLPMIMSSIAPTLALTVPAFIFTFLLSLFLALTSLRFSRKFSQGAFISFCLALMSVSFVIYILALQYIFTYILNWFPVSGWPDSFTEKIYHLLLPWLITTVVGLGPHTLLLRSFFLQQLDKDYIRTAQAKGVDSNRILYRHVLSNSLLPIITLISLEVPFLIMGSILLESYFSIPGAGSLLVEAIYSHDFPVIKALSFLGAFIYVLSQILADATIRFFDPRLRWT